MKRVFCAGVFSGSISSVYYPAMGVAPYRWGAMAQSNSSSDSSLGEESLRRTIFKEVFLLDL